MSNRPKKYNKPKPLSREHDGDGVSDYELYQLIAALADDDGGAKERDIITVYEWAVNVRMNMMGLLGALRGQAKLKVENGAVGFRFPNEKDLEQIIVDVMRLNNDE